MAGYSSRSLVEKLGIKPETTVVLLGGPPRYADMLGDLPTGARITTRLPREAAFVHQFARLRIELEAAIARVLPALSPDGVLWVSWPKKAARVPTDITEDTVRGVAVPLGLVDVKVCSVNDVWSGLKLVRRKHLRAPKSP